MLRLSEPRILERGPYRVAGAWHPYEGEDEGPGWAGAYTAFVARQPEIQHRVDHMTLGFLYRPHRDHPAIAEHVRACFVGVEVTEAAPIADGLATTRFPGGRYAVMKCRGDTQAEATEGVGEAVKRLATLIEALGHVQGTACFACSAESMGIAPYIEWVYMKVEEEPR